MVQIGPLTAEISTVPGGWSWLRSLCVGGVELVAEPMCRLEKLRIRLSQPQLIWIELNWIELRLSLAIFHIWVDFTSRDKNLHVIWKLQFCNRCHFLSWKTNFMKIFVHIIWVCKHSDFKFESTQNFCKNIKNCPKIGSNL